MRMPHTNRMTMTTSLLTVAWMAAVAPHGLAQEADAGANGEQSLVLPTGDLCEHQTLWRRGRFACDPALHIKTRTSNTCASLIHCEVFGPDPGNRWSRILTARKRNESDDGYLDWMYSVSEGDDGGVFFSRLWRPDNGKPTWRYPFGMNAETVTVGLGIPGYEADLDVSGNASIGGTLNVAGAARVDVLEIVGADIAEKFPTSESDELEPGTVMAIDPSNPGELCLARGAYNRCVAGVVSGASDVPVGAVLGHLPEQCPNAPAVALSGRVWVRCDASQRAIAPGDMLTTADVPGHAMAASDRNRAHGAVIGKAMTPLEQGKRGLVLVLVNLH